MSTALQDFIVQLYIFSEYIFRVLSIYLNDTFLQVTLKSVNCAVLTNTNQHFKLLWDKLLKIYIYVNDTFWLEKM